MSGRPKEISAHDAIHTSVALLVTTVVFASILAEILRTSWIESRSRVLVLVHRSGIILASSIL